MLIDIRYKSGTTYKRTWTTCFNMFQSDSRNMSECFTCYFQNRSVASAEAFVEAVLPGDVSPGAVQAALYVQGLRYHSASDEPEKVGSVEMGTETYRMVLIFCGWE